jgi:hypothetical protein
LALVQTDYLSGSNTTVTGGSGAGLTWVLVVRTNVQSGSSEIWRAFPPSPLTNVSVTAILSQSGVLAHLGQFFGSKPWGNNGSAAVGATASANAKSGAPKATLVTTQNGSWVFGTGNDYDNAIARTPGAAQSLVHQYLTPTGDTYWVQMQNAPTPASGTSVTINDTAPTGDRYNLSICEVLPAVGATYSPPYLFRGARPTITQAPSQITYATGFFVRTPDAANIQSAVLSRTAAGTHFFDQNTRYVPLTFQQGTGGLTLTAPADAYLAPPSYYMLFLVNSNGVPSVAPFVQLQ